MWHSQRARPAYFVPSLFRMITLFRLLARVPLPLMLRLGTLLGWVVWWGSSGYRSRFKANAEAAGFTPEQYRPGIAAAGAALAELPFLWGRPAGVSVLPHVASWSGTEAVEAALEMLLPTNKQRARPAYFRPQLFSDDHPVSPACPCAAFADA